MSVQIISKTYGKYKVVKSIGSGRTEQEIEKLWILGKQEIERLSAQSKIFISEQDMVVEQAMESLANANISTVGSKLVFGKLYDHIGFGQIQEALFRHLVIARLAYSLSKLKTVLGMMNEHPINRIEELLPTNNKLFGPEQSYGQQRKQTNGGLQYAYKVLM